MAAKIRLTNTIRDAILEWMMKQHDAKTSPVPAALEAVVTTVRKAIQIEYPEKDMKVLAKYNQVEKVGPTIKFSVIDTGRVIGVEFGYDKVKTLDLPMVPKSLSYNKVHSATVEDEKVINNYIAVKTKYDLERTKTEQQYRSFVYGVRYVEDIMEVVPLPTSLTGNLLAGRTALVAINPEIISKITHDFEGLKSSK